MLESKRKVQEVPQRRALASAFWVKLCVQALPKAPDARFDVQSTFE
jgi:hypothetical protein